MYSGPSWPRSGTGRFGSRVAPEPGTKHLIGPLDGSGGQAMADTAGGEVLGPLFRGKAQLQLEAHATQHIARAVADRDRVVRALVE